MIKIGGEQRSGRSVLAVQHDDDIYIYIYMYIHTHSCPGFDTKLPQVKFWSFRLCGIKLSLPLHPRVLIPVRVLLMV